MVEKERMLNGKMGKDGITREGCSLDEVADELGVTRERVRQIEKRALTKLLAWCKWHGLAFHNFLD